MKPNGSLDQFYLCNFSGLKSNLFLKQPLFLSVQKQDSKIKLTQPDFNVVAEGKTLKEALENLEKEISWLWAEYAETPDSNLSLDALQLKQKLLDMVGKITA